MTTTIAVLASQGAGEERAMRNKPTDAEVPREILASINERREESHNKVVEWLFLRFKNIEDAERLSRCLVVLLEKLRGGLVLEHPVGLLNTMLFEAWCDEKKRQETERRMLRKLRRPREAVKIDPARDFLDYERRSAVFYAVTDLPEATPAVVWERAAGISAEETAGRLAAGWGEKWTAGRVRTVYYRAKAHLRRRLADFEPDER